MGKIIGARQGEVNKPTRFLAVFGIIAFIVLAFVGGFFLVTYIQGLAIAPDTTPTTLNKSSITMTDWTSRENLGELCPVTVRGNRIPITSVDERFDITNYEIVSTEVMPDDFDKDLSEYTDIIIRVNPDEATDGFWTTYDFMFMNSEKNHVYRLYGYHEATDIYGNVLNVIGGGAWNKTYDAHGAESGNFTIPIWFPPETFTEPHQGNHFAITDDIADLSATTLAKLYNERWYRSMPTLFSLVDDTSNHDISAGPYSMITETSAFKFVFNDTISTTDASATQVNFTATCDYDFQVEIHNDTLFVVLTESWDTKYGNFGLDFEISMGDNITNTFVYGGTVIIPNRYFGTDYTYTSLQTLA